MSWILQHRYMIRFDRVRPDAGLALGIVLGSSLILVITFASETVLIGSLAAMLITGALLAFSSQPVCALSVELEAPAIAEDTRRRVLPPGRCIIGSIAGRGYSNELRARHVRVPAFQCMLVPVTRQLFAQVMGRDPGWPRGGSGRLPANNISWLEAIEFCNALSRLMGVTPCYEIKGNDHVIWHDTEGYRLPTEAEWEYACRGGSWVDYCFGNDRSALHGYAWFEDNANNRPQAVGRKRPNGWGLYDMHGNVWEWCWDEYTLNGHASLPSGPGTVFVSHGRRVVRGGAFFLPAGALRSPVRRGEEPHGRDVSIGFRCVRGRYYWEGDG